MPFRSNAVPSLVLGTFIALAGSALAADQTATPAAAARNAWWTFLQPGDGAGAVEQSHGSATGGAPRGQGGSDEGFVTLCHCPPGNRGNCHTKRVSARAAVAHEAHGDALGPCPTPSPSEP